MAAMRVFIKTLQQRVGGSVLMRTPTIDSIAIALSFPLYLVKVSVDERSEAINPPQHMSYSF